MTTCPAWRIRYSSKTRPSRGCNCSSCPGATDLMRKPIKLEIGNAIRLGPPRRGCRGAAPRPSVRATAPRMSSVLGVVVAAGSEQSTRSSTCPALPDEQGTTAFRTSPRQAAHHRRAVELRQHAIDDQCRIDRRSRQAAKPSSPSAGRLRADVADLPTEPLTRSAAARRSSSMMKATAHRCGTMGRPDGRSWPTRSFSHVHLSSNYRKSETGKLFD